jgi:hypothetical protein
MSKETAVNGADIPTEFHAVVEKHGREIFALTMNAGMGQQALTHLLALVQKHHSRDGVHAVQVITNCFNQVASALALKEGWTAEQLVACDQDAQRAHKEAIILPGSRIILNS